jgi:tetratricopeptide (TPR) repeat protein
VTDFLQQGIAQAQLGDYSTAIATLTKAIANQLEVVEAYYQRGLVYDELGKLESAIADYNQSLNLDPQQVKVYLHRATAFLALDNPQNCLIDLQIILTLDPNCPQAYDLRGTVCLRFKEYDQAIDYFKQAGKIYLARQDKENCRYSIARIRQIEQQKIARQGGVTNQVWLQQIKQKISQGKLGEAFHDCSWLLQLDPYAGEAYECRGQISLKLGELNQARKDLLQGVKCFRTQGDMIDAARLERRCLELQLEDVYQSRPTPEIDSFPRTSAPQNAIQQRLFGLVGNWKIAQSLVERLRQRYPEKPETWYWEKAIQDIEGDRL